MRPFSGAPSGQLLLAMPSCPDTYGWQAAIRGAAKSKRAATTVKARMATPKQDSSQGTSAPQCRRRRRRGCKDWKRVLQLLEHMARNLPQWRAYKDVAVLVRSLERARRRTW